MSTLNLIFISLVLFIRYVNGQTFVLPQSPCPDVLRYEINNIEKHAGDAPLRCVITVPPIFPLHLKIRMQLQVALTKKYGARLVLRGKKSTILKKYVKGTLKKMSYNLFFPDGLPLPQITLIELNGNVLCSSFPIPRRVRTDFELQQSFQIVSSQPQFEWKPQKPIQQDNDWSEDKSHELYNDFFTNDDYSGRNQNPHRSNTYRKPPITVYIPNRRMDQTSPDSQVSFPDSTYDPDRPSEPYNFRPGPTPCPNISPSSRTQQMCGKPIRRNQLIVGGTPLSQGDLPWMVPLFKKTPYNFACTSVLISELYVLTAAHCVWSDLERPFGEIGLLAYVGRFNLHTWSDSIQAREIVEVSVHPDYHPDSAGADLAVLTLNESVTFTPFVSPICVWSESDDLSEIVGSEGVVAGWGRPQTGDRPGPTHTAIPHSVTVPIVGQSECIFSRREFRHLTSDKTLCAGSRNDYLQPDILEREGDSPEGKRPECSTRI